MVWFAYYTSDGIIVSFYWLFWPSLSAVILKYGIGNYPTWEKQTGLRTVLGKKNVGFDPPSIFANFLSKHIIFYDKVNMGHKFLYPPYGARIWARRSHKPEFRPNWHFQIWPKSRGWPRNFRLRPRTCSDPLGQSIFLINFIFRNFWL